MKLVTLQPVEGSQKSVEIKVGRTIIGRGPLLECGDKKVSRNHAIIEVSESGDIYLTPTHVNPCFYLPNDSNAGFEVLKKDCAQLIHNGDSFSLLPNSFRYRVSISDVSDYDNIESEKNIVATAAAVAAASTTAASKVKESSSTTSTNTTSGIGSKRDETLLNGDNKKDLKEEANHKASPVEESPKDNGKPTPPVKNGLSPVRASSRRTDSKSSVDKDLTGHRDQQNKSHSPNKQNSSESHDLTKDTAPAASVKEKESKSRESRKSAIIDDSKSDRKSFSRDTANSSASLTFNSKDKSPLASKKILSEKSAPKKDARKEKTDSEKQKQLKNFDFDDEDDEPVVKPTGKKPPPKAQARKPAEKPTPASTSTSLTPSTSKKKEPPSRKRSPPPSTTSAISGASGSRSTRTHRTLIQRISLDDFMASDEEWIATYASSDEERKKARKRLAKRKSAAEVSSDEDDWSGKKPRKRPARKSRKANTDDENDESEDVDAEEEEEVKPKRSRGRPSTNAKRNKKKTKAVDVSESSEESKNDAESGDDVEDDHDDDVESKTPAKKSQVPKKKETPKTSAAAATPTPPKKKVFRRKKSLLYAESEEDFQRQLARAIRESKKEQMKKECEKREKATGYRPTDHAALSSTTAST